MHLFIILYRLYMSAFMSREAAKSWWGVDLPKEIAYLSKDIFDNKWKPTTYQDIYNRKVTLQRQLLRRKLSFAYSIPAYVWVFKNENFPFSGYWIYIKTRKKDIALNFRCDNYKHLIPKIMNLFNCGILCFDFYQWAPVFIKKYAKEAWGRDAKHQGIVICHAHFNDWGQLIDISA